MNGADLRLVIDNPQNTNSVVPLADSQVEGLHNSLPSSGAPIVTMVRATENGESFTVPGDYIMVGNRPMRLNTGAILLQAPSRKGKTTLLTAWSLLCMQHGVTVGFLSVGEPGSPGGFEGLKNFESQLTTLISQCAGGVVFVDSITFAIYTLTVVNQLQTNKAGTLPGGIDLVHSISMVYLDSLARASGVCLVMSVNADYFPAASKFDGVVSGYASIVDFGVLNMNTRWAGREDTEFTFPKDVIAQARTLIQGGAFATAPDVSFSGFTPLSRDSGYEIGQDSALRTIF